MSYDFSIAGQYSGRPAYDLYFYIRRDQTDVANNRSSYAWELRARNPSGSSATYALDQYNWAVNVGGANSGGTHDMDFRGGQAYLVLGSGTTGWYGHAADGTLNLLVGAQHGPAGVFGTAHPADQYFPTDRILKAPSTPPVATLNSRTATSINFTRGTSADNGGATVTNYNYQISTSSSFSTILQSWSGTAATWDRTGLSRATTYYVRYQSVNSVGASGWSPTLTVTTAQTVPSTPAKLIYDSETANSVSFHRGGLIDDGGSTITTYDYQLSTASSFASVLQSWSGTAVSWTRTGLTRATTYYVRHRAVNGVGDSNWSTPLAITTDQTVPSTPPVLTLDGKTSTTVSVSRSGLIDNGGSPITTYDYQLSTSSSFASILQSWSGTSSAWTRTGLTRSTTYYLRYRAVNAVGSSNWSPTLTVTTDQTVPSTPPTPTMVSRTPTSVTIRRGSSSDTGGSTITYYEFQRATNSTFIAGLSTWTSSATDQTAASLAPGTTYYFRYRAVNAIGNSDWSGTLAQATLPSAPPGMSVVPSLSGTSATITLSPPAGTASVTSYRIERRVQGTTTATVINSTTSPVTSAVTPGVIYEWRASAFIDTYQTPWTDWLPVLQPKPSTTPGDYFDGSTAARGDVTFAWLGTVNNSVSESRGVGVQGWSAFSGSGGTVRLQRVTGGFAGSYAARTIALSDMTSQGGMVVGMANTAVAAVAEGGIYQGSIYVRPSRRQRLYAELLWLNASGVELSRVNGAAADVASTTSWTRLVVSGTAPTGAVGAVVRVRDNGGTGYSAWLTGEYLDTDGAMVTIGALYPYFDGATPDTMDYRYDWLGTANASASSRTTLDPGVVDPLADPDCPPIPAAPLPPAIDDSCIEDVGTWRRYWAIIPDGEISQWLSVVPTITLTTGAQAARQVRIRFYPNPNNLEPGVDADLAVESEQVVSYIPPKTVFTLDGVSEQATASVNGADSIFAGHLLYGTRGGPATWPVMSCGTGYLVSFDVPLDAAAGNLSVGVALTTRMM